MSDIFYCDSCFQHVVNDKYDDCKYRHHDLRKDKEGWKAKKNKEFKKLKRNSGKTSTEKEEAKKRIDELYAQIEEVYDWNEFEDDKTVTDLLVDILKGGIEDSAKNTDFKLETWIKLKWGENGKVMPLKLDGIHAEAELANRWFELENSTLSKTPYQDAIRRIKYEVLRNGKEVKIHQRICFTHVNDKPTIYYDLGDNAYSLLRIFPYEFEGKNHHMIVGYNKHSPFFDRVPDIQEQKIHDIANDRIENSLDKLCDLLKIRDRLIFKVNLIHFFFPHLESPFIFFTAEYGAGKSTASEAIRSIVDPASAKGSRISEDITDLQTMLASRFVTVFDNVNTMNQEQSDCLCRALSGDSLDKRVLYTDGELYTKSYSNKKIVLNGTAPNIDYPDFISRNNFIDAGINPDSDSVVSKSEIRKQVAQLVPHIIREICIIISKTLATHDDTGKKVKPVTRMADFEMWGETISQAMGIDAGKFLDAYRTKYEQTRKNQISNYPELEILVEKLKDVTMPYEDRISEVWKSVCERAGEDNLDIKNSEWAKNPGQFVKYLKKMRGVVRKAGYEFETGTWRKIKPVGWKDKVVITFHSVVTQDTILKSDKK